MRTYLRYSKHFFFILLILFAGGKAKLQAQERGTIKGEVINFETGEPLSGANVLVQDTKYATSTDEKGIFQLQFIPQGTYTIKVSLIGYLATEQKDVRVEKGETVYLLFQLRPTEVLLKERIEVIGKRPLMDIDVPATRRDIGKEDIERIMIHQLADILTLQAGIVEQDKKLHIRGARAYENLYLVEGIIMEDPFSTRGLGFNLSPSAIEELSVVTGGMEAEYGQVTSGVIDVKIKEGEEKFHGYLTYKQDHFGWSAPYSFNTDILDFSLSGPFFKNLYFFVNAQTYLSDTHMPSAKKLYSSTFGGSSFAPRGDNRFSLIGKLSLKPDPLRKLSFSFGKSVVIDQDKSILSTRIKSPIYSYGYPYEYKNILDSYNTFTHESNFQILSWEQKISLNTSYQLRLSRFFTNLHSDVNGKHWSEYTMPEDYLPLEIAISPDSTYYIVTAGDGFYDWGDGDTWYDHFIESFSFRYDFSHVFGKFYRVKTGLYHQYQTIQLLDIYKPWLGQAGLGLNYDLYRVFANDGAFFWQNNFNFGDAWLNLGVRYEYWFPGKYVERAVEDTNLTTEEVREKFHQDTFDFLGSRAKGVFSPRVGFSTSLSENLRFFFDYSQLSKKPNPQYVYAKLFTTTESTYQLFGNPNLNPERVITYEVGLKFLITPQDALRVVGYYRSIYDAITAVGVIPEEKGKNPYMMYFNLDFGFSRGIELQYLKEVGEKLFLGVDLSFSKASGERSLPSDVLKGIPGRAYQTLYQEYYLDWDKPWQISFNLSYYEDEKKKILGLTLPSNWEFNLRGWAQAGKRYTSFKAVTEDEDTIFVQSGDFNEKIGEYLSSVDLNLQKHFHFRAFKYTLFCEITNLFDRKNPTVINPLTGDAYQEGEMIPYGVDNLLLPEFGSKLPFWEDPARYSSPRNIKLGIALRW
jgi:outer membrane receptor protein involved in Fe transport